MLPFPEPEPPVIPYKDGFTFGIVTIDVHGGFFRHRDAVLGTAALGAPHAPRAGAGRVGVGGSRRKISV
jgi:hypothetical protein